MPERICRSGAVNAEVNPHRLLAEFVGEARIAYFSMEVALETAIHTYSGGLGCLAGDTLRSAADIGLPLVGVAICARRSIPRADRSSRRTHGVRKITPHR
jgi:glucan phosphorylase